MRPALEWQSLIRGRSSVIAQDTWPWAAPIFWETALVSPEKPVLRPPQELKKMLADRGVTPGKKIISYCEVGWQASYTYFLARYLGFDAAMYDGSFNEWSTAKQPVVRGDSAR